MAKSFVLFVLMVGGVLCKPINSENNFEAASADHRIQKRFIDSEQTFGSFPGTGLTKMRTKRSFEEDCEKLRLCKLHAQSNRNFLAAFELYFVNKENARLWDHSSRSLSDCYRRFSGCYRR